ncbi:hypothetical protein DQ04_09171030 [Trypanosoma grayi]|uniref:hypothetical protein n=1 Tax=Trypanosoma grayi TaxID=71804 RepID=UPI0004F4B0CC|nr:hypothetical protein DQ04_09171030 [Trypanosoma grayi]KEG07656.1 hypothetical protein DQ04_09171030 [Trypanosoma grayi]
MLRWIYTGAAQDWRKTEPPVVSRSNSPYTFATALAEQSSRAFLQFTHSPTVVGLLREQPCLGSEMEACILQLGQLEDLLSLLQRISLPQDAAGTAAQAPRLVRETFVAVCNEEPASNGEVNLYNSVADEIIGWLQLLAWARCFAVFLMQRLVAIHDQVSWYLWYWSWAEVHPAQASFHLALGSRSWWHGFMRRGYVGQMLQVQSGAIAHKSALNRVLRGVVRGLGAVYSLVDRMNVLVSSMEETTSSTHVHSISELEVVGCAECQAAEQRLLVNVRGAVASTVTLLAKTVQLRDVGQAEASTSGGASSDMLMFSTYANESMLFELQPKFSTDVMQKQASATASLKESLYLLRDTVEYTRNCIKALSEDVHTKHVPPKGRYWRSIFITCCTVLPSVLWLSSRSMSNLFRMVASARLVLHGLAANYVVSPLKEIARSIFGGRPGVIERRRTLEMEMESVANIVRDYHEDYYANISQVELQRLRDRTFEHLRSGVVADDEGYRLINGHYETAIRRPITSALFGNLLRLMLIQLSYQQLEVMRVVNSTDEVLEGNDLNFKAMAMVPVIVFLGGVLFVSFQKRRAKLRPVNRQLKRHWRSVHRVVTLAEDSRDGLLGLQGNQEKSLAITKNDEVLCLAEVGSATNLNNYDQGIVLLMTHHMRRLAMEYHTNYRHLEEFLEDLDDLESVQSTRQQRLLTLNRMRQVHRFLW